MRDLKAKHLREINHFSKWIFIKSVEWHYMNFENASHREWPKPLPTHILSEPLHTFHLYDENEIDTIL